MRAVTTTYRINPDQAVALEENADGTFTIVMSVGEPLTGVPQETVALIWPHIFPQPPPPPPLPEFVPEPMPPVSKPEEEQDATQEG
jgi:hypothetical protein